MDDADIVQIISSIYEASSDELMWSHVALKLSELFDDSAVGIDSSDLAAGTVNIEESARFDIALRSLHYEGYDRPESNPGVAALMKAPLWEPFELWSFVNQDIYERDPSIRAILHPQKIDKVLLSTLERSETNFSFLTLFRNESQSDFEDRHNQIARRLSPHLARSMKWQRQRLGSQREEEVARHRAVNSAELTGSLVVSASGVVLHADRSAQVILELREGITLKTGRLTSTGQRMGQDHEALQKYLADDQFANATFTAASQASITILERMPIPMAAGGRPVQTCHALILRRIPRQPTYEIAAFVSAFGLTDGEARVVAALLSSSNASEAAKRLDIGRETVKTHLSSIYKKTDTTSLPQLMLTLGRFL